LGLVAVCPVFSLLFSSFFASLMLLPTRFFPDGCMQKKKKRKKEKGKKKEN
jgi:hypothetical protein